MRSAVAKKLPKLPIGIQSFKEMRTGGYTYVDKTSFVAELANQGKYWFLSRPRRFGKSLLIDTIDCAFSGRRELFKGLFLDFPESEWDWEAKHPVIRVSLSGGPYVSREALREVLDNRIDTSSERLGVEPPKAGSPSLRLETLVRSVSKKWNTGAVVLVDEYDKPILDVFSNPELVAIIRDELRSFYGVLKDVDEYVRFVLLTGVSKFSKAGIFSGLNNLNDLTLDPAFSSICGYTEDDLDTVFHSHCEGLDREMIRRWYNGYSWGGESVYNPFDLLLLIQKRLFNPWWFETGTPTFLIKLLQEQPRSLYDLDNCWMGSELTDSVEPESMRLEIVLFQTGYLTIKELENIPGQEVRYRLGFPNLEVRSSFSRLAIEAYAGNPSQVNSCRNLLREALKAGNAEALRDIFHGFFASIPVDWYRKSPIGEYEGFYCSVVYGYFASLGFDLIAEDTTNKGRIDLTVKTPWGIWIFEFKVKSLDGSKAHAKNPLIQLKEKGYVEKYKPGASGNPAELPVRLVGIVFDTKTRNLDFWQVVQA